MGMGPPEDLVSDGGRGRTAFDTGLEGMPQEREGPGWSWESVFFRLLDLGMKGSPDLQ